MEVKYKQYVIVPKRPKMSPGKIASQVAHATYLAIEYQTERPFENIIKQWEKQGMCVIVLECKDTHQLSNIALYLKYWEVPFHLYIDEGLTEVEPFTPTALATGILTEDKFWIFEKMKVFK